MKSSEKWASEVGHESPLMFHISLIKEIQLDAWKQGMNDAVEICRYGYENGHYSAEANRLKDEILTACERKI